MALQDLTPQLRTRLSRMERAVGWFLLLASALLVFGFVYYIIVTAERKGWFKAKVRYQTSINNAAGLRVGDPVKLMGFDVGQITSVEANGPGDWYGVTVNFWVKEPYYGYLWSDSVVKVEPANFLGDRFIEVTKGASGVPTIREDAAKRPTGLLRRDAVKKLQADLQKALQSEGSTNATQAIQSFGTLVDISVVSQLNDMSTAHPNAFYTNYNPEMVYWLDPAETPALTERLQGVVTAVEKALPNFLQLTNSLARVLSNATRITASADEVIANFKPVSSNLAVITENIREPRGGLGEWFFPTNMNARLTETLGSAAGTLNLAQTNLTALTTSLDNVANITSNLNVQVQMNTNMLGAISTTVVHADELVQGLKRHWLLRSAFKNKTPASHQPPAMRKTLRSPKDEPR